MGHADEGSVTGAVPEAQPVGPAHSDAEQPALSIEQERMVDEGSPVPPVPEPSPEEATESVEMLELMEQDSDRSFRQHYLTHYTASGATFADFQSAYRYGYAFASDKRLSYQAWQFVETEAREHWEQQNPGTWEQVREAIHFGWSCLQPGNETVS